MTKLLSFISLKWKLSLSLVAMALSFVGIYVLLAKKTFESDKISYIFETQLRQVGSMADTVSSQIERILFDARSIATGFDPSAGRFSQATQPIFWEHPQILAIAVSEGADFSKSISMEKSPGLAEQAQTTIGPAPSPQPQLIPLDSRRYALSLSAKSGQLPISLLVVFEMKDLVGEGMAGQALAFVSANKVVELSSNSPLNGSAIEEFLVEQGASLQDTTLIHSIQNSRFLISSAQLGYGGYRFLSLIEEEKALGALNSLFRKSLIFLAFSFFASVIVALLLSNRLTQNINSLTVTAEKIGAGDFSTEPDFKSNDEVGILSNAFRKMAREIQRLLAETVDKTRMETELKTARLVQDSLFPQSATYQNGHVRLCGTNKTTTECGGDWWFYYQKGSELYVLVADATGHGIPAALITAAARSLFAYIKDTEADLPKIASSWDKSIFECSNGKVNMTAFLLQINVELGECQAINAGHEPPIQMSRKGDGSFTSSYLTTQRNHSLGERKGSWLVDRYQLSPGDRLVIFTDGLLAIKSPEGKGYSEKRFLTYLNKLMTTPEPTPEQLVKKIDSDFDQLNAGQLLPDDVTLVILDYRA